MWNVQVLEMEPLPLDARGHLVHNRKTLVESVITRYIMPRDEKKQQSKLIHKCSTGQNGCVTYEGHSI